MFSCRTITKLHFRNFIAEIPLHANSSGNNQFRGLNKSRKHLFDLDFSLRHEVTKRERERKGVKFLIRQKFWVIYKNVINDVLPTIELDNQRWFLIFLWKNESCITGFKGEYVKKTKKNEIICLNWGRLYWLCNMNLFLSKSPIHCG